MLRLSLHYIFCERTEKNGGGSGVYAVRRHHWSLCTQKQPKTCQEFCIIMCQHVWMVMYIDSLTDRLCLQPADSAWVVDHIRICKLAGACVMGSRVRLLGNVRMCEYSKAFKLNDTAWHLPLKTNRRLRARHRSACHRSGMMCSHVVAVLLDTNLQQMCYPHVLLHATAP